VKKISSPIQVFLVVMSAKGVLGQALRDCPLTLTSVYPYLLRGTSDDKQAMGAMGTYETPAGGVVVVVRPGVLSDGAGRCLQAVQRGTIEQPVQVYSISRNDVGS